MKLTRAAVCKAINAGDTILVHKIHEDFTGAVIEKFTRGTARHEICCMGGLDIVEALTAGVSFGSLANYMTGEYRLTLKRVRQPLTMAETVTVREFWLKRRGQPYGWNSCLQASITTIVRRYLRPWAPGPAKALQGVARAVLGCSLPDCSALWIEGIRLVRPHVLGAYEAQEITPEMVMRDSHLTEVAKWNAPDLEDA